MDDREPLGRIAHGIYRDWLTEQVQRMYGDAEQSSWEDLTEGMREAYMRMGSAVAARAVADAGLEGKQMRHSPSRSLPRSRPRTGPS